MQQLSMLDLMMPPAPPVVAKPWEPPPRREFLTRAYGVEEMMEINLDERDPIEIEVRGIPTLVRFSSFFQTYTVQPAGSVYWSETGFKSFAGFYGRIDDGLTPAVLEQIICADIDSKHGCNGKLTKWWPSYCLQWRQNKTFADKFDRATTWDQWGPEKQAEHWASHDARQAAALQQMAAEGIDPDEVWRTRR
ncbi:hypothetical protein MNR02_06515 [Shinella sp. H4-D48]|uniref:hypothetical protein n=1 Tax=Shinella sp. H4-D48 TaxID=2925841 RepID=UPI001F532F4A|nr:hypothetical protein [Shinella sp. H4-D48]UNK39354.1 hypothetical protein MNR02_06515 [Shinella sp. H4-D48]